jgi:prepilin-type N-terminal cleavage/methylation domain-containing protein
MKPGDDTPRLLANEAGFTLVELLVVMLILGVLASIAISSFFNQSDKARDANAKAAARTAETAMEAYATDHDGRYTGADPTALGGIEPTLNGASLTVDSALASRYQVTVMSPTGNAFHIARAADATTSLTCDTPGTAGCPAGGNWG